MNITFPLVFVMGVFMQKANAEPMFQAHSPSAFSIDGSVAKVLKDACDEFVLSGKDIRDFTISISEENRNTKDDPDEVYVVTFLGKLIPGKTRGLGTANRFPGSVTYFISRNKWKIIKEQGIK